MAAAVLTSSILRIKASSSAFSKSRRVRRPQNVDGDLFVDNTCIDCDTCRWMAPEIFKRQDGMSAVLQQPTCHEERIRALQALLSCPTNSIHTEQPPRDILAVHKTFPSPINEDKIQGVYHCGYHSEKSYGATSYFVQRPEGNILIDSPRYTERLASNIKKMGGVRFMFLTHRDDVADHDKWSKELGCSRIIHSEEVCDSTADVEIKLEGNGPWTLGSDITLIHTPGHTKGSVCLLDKTRRILFTVTEQLKSVQKLVELDFEWILPGHGRRASFKNAQEKDSSLKAFLAARGFQG
ncbi:uncharacterized protein LOC125211156 isoform X2 [Salvia hispanica]|uniref:uncharacterized protein LOC125211156 isoform X2 n=1 Tax=Salvia hispanica TaxID=49212 RepID=UPI0020092E6C|nr:uncharacterized protein LOC125211156 isoform X2 [Salvia hispanica]